MFHLNKKTFYQKSLECWKWQRSKWQEEHKPADGSMEFFFLQLFLHDTWLVWRLPGNVPGSDRQLCNWIVRFFIQYLKLQNSEKKKFLLKTQMLQQNINCLGQRFSNYSATHEATTSALRSVVIVSS